MTGAPAPVCDWPVADAIALETSRTMRHRGPSGVWPKARPELCNLYRIPSSLKDQKLIVLFGVFIKRLLLQWFRLRSIFLRLSTTALLFSALISERL